MIEDRELDIATIERTPSEQRTDKQREVWDKYIKDKEHGDKAVANYWASINQKKDEQICKVNVSDVIKSIKIQPYHNNINLSQYTNDEVNTMLTAFYKQQVLSRKTSCEFNDDVRNVLADTSRWLVNPPKPGLLLRGYVGVGKTIMLYSIQKILEVCIKKRLTIVTAKQVVNMVIDDRDAYERLKTNPLVGIDDIGDELKEVKVYGNVIYPIGELLTERNKNMLYTIITTNLPNQSIKLPDGTIMEGILEKYGKRVEDRLSELCNNVNYNPNMKSFRK